MSDPLQNLSRSLANLSFCDQIVENSSQNSQNQDTGFNNSAIPLYPHSMWTLAPSEKDQIIASSSKNNEPKTRNSDFTTEKAAVSEFFTCAVTSEGSRKLQEIIMAGNPSVVSEVLKKVTFKVSGTPLLYFLMIDSYGCHVCSKLIDSCNEQQLCSLVENIITDHEILINVSTNRESSKVMKRLIKSVKGTSYSSLIVLRLSAMFDRLMTNETGMYLVNHCLDSLDLNAITPLYEQAVSQCLALATHKNGCVSLNYVIERIQGVHRRQLLELVAKNTVFLSQDPFGNHVVQKVLGLENHDINGVIGSLLRGNYVKLSMQKKGSHVVEKCLKSQAGMEYVIEDFLNCGSSQLVQIARDQFGNYVVQRALEVTKHRDELLYLKLVSRLNEKLSALRSGYGKNVFNQVMAGIQNAMIK